MMIAPSRFVQRSSTPRSILAVTVGFGLMALPIVALEEQHVHPNSSTSQKLQRFTTSSQQKNPWAIEYPPEILRDPQHLRDQHKAHVHMKDGPASWHEGLQRWWHHS